MQKKFVWVPILDNLSSGNIKKMKMIWEYSLIQIFQLTAMIQKTYDAKNFYIKLRLKN